MGGNWWITRTWISLMAEELNSKERNCKNIRRQHQQALVTDQWWKTGHMKYPLQILNMATGLKGVPLTKTENTMVKGGWWENSKKRFGDTGFEVSLDRTEKSI